MLNRERGIPVNPVILDHPTTLKDQIGVPMFFGVAFAPSIGAITSAHLDPLDSVMEVNPNNGSVEINISPSAWDANRRLESVPSIFKRSSPRFQVWSTTLTSAPAQSAHLQSASDCG